MTGVLVRDSINIGSREATLINCTCQSAIDALQNRVCVVDVVADQTCIQLLTADVHLGLMIREAAFLEFSDTLMTIAIVSSRRDSIAHRQCVARTIMAIIVVSAKHTTSARSDFISQPCLGRSLLVK